MRSVSKRGNPEYQYLSLRVYSTYESFSHFWNMNGPQPTGVVACGISVAVIARRVRLPRNAASGPVRWNTMVRSSVASTWTSRYRPRSADPFFVSITQSNVDLTSFAVTAFPLCKAQHA